MLNLTVYNMRDLQNTISLLIQSERNGLNIQELIKELSSYVTTITNKNNEKKIKGAVKPGIYNQEGGKFKNPYIKKCPSCDKGALELFLIDEEKIRMCKKCRYSEYMGEI